MDFHQRYIFFHGNCQSVTFVLSNDLLENQYNMPVNPKQVTDCFRNQIKKLTGSYWQT